MDNLSVEIIFVFLTRGEKEIVTPSVENENGSVTSDVRRRDSNANEKGFRRSSTWVFDDSICDNGMTTSMKFDDVLEEVCILFLSKYQLIYNFLALFF